MKDDQPTRTHVSSALSGHHRAKRTYLYVFGGGQRRRRKIYGPFGASRRNENFNDPKSMCFDTPTPTAAAKMATCISITNCWLLAFFLLLSQKRCRRFGNLGWRRMEKRKGGRGISARRRHTASVRECENKDACLAHTLAADRTHPQLEKFSGKLWSFSKFKCHVKNSVFFLYFSTTTFKNL